MKKHLTYYEESKSMTSKTFEAFHQYINDGLEIPIHCHDFYEIYLALSGDVVYRIEEEKYQLTQGSILIISPNKFHKPEINPNTPFERMLIWVEKDYLHNIIDNESISNLFFKDGILLNTGTNFEKVNTLFNRIINEYEENNEDFEDYCKALIHLLLLEINRINRNNQDSLNKVVPNVIATNVLSYINSHFIDKIDLDIIAKECYVSKYYLSHIFRSEFGTSVHQYIIQKRLQYSKELIEKGYSLIDAAKESGFGDYAIFYRCFKKNFNCSPLQYRKNI